MKFRDASRGEMNNIKEQYRLAINTVITSMHIQGLVIRSFLLSSI